jgi:hypothetical protein
MSPKPHEDKYELTTLETSERIELPDSDWEYREGWGSPG